MIRINDNFLKLQASYLFADIKNRIEAFQNAHPEMEVIKLGIGDVTHALPQACIEAMHAGVDDLSRDETFHGYGPEQGYAFLREAIAEHDFQARGADIAPDEIFVSDGAKCDTGNFQEILATEIRIALPDPVYPVYLDTNVMAGRTGEFADGRYQDITYLECTRDNGFVPGLPDQEVDLIYLCYPNNPTGATITHHELQAWVDYARENKALILFDAAYENFIRDESIPHSIYELEGAREVAVEFRSYSKKAGFTGTRCAYTVVPRDCIGTSREGREVSIHDLWFRRQSTKFNGVSYPVQCAAKAVYSPEGARQVRELADTYLANAAIILEVMRGLGFHCTGGTNSPYIWIDGGERSSWDFFDLLLNQAGVVCTPGAGFGKCGQRFIRISAFNSRENVQKAMERIEKALS
jgi:LL-diaminopimelate aminotransferase